MMKSFSTNRLYEPIKEALLEMNFSHDPAYLDLIRGAKEAEQSPLGKRIFTQMLENEGLAREEKRPICQDTGMVVCFVTLGQELILQGPFIGQVINQAVRDAYQEGYLRKSVVKDPFDRVNTDDNTPAVIHYQLVPGDQLSVAIGAKGFGSENMSKAIMLPPTAGKEGVIDFVKEVVRQAGPNACPPLTLGVGIGGTLEKAALLAKEALLAEEKDPSEEEELEASILNEVNQLGIGPQGLGGSVTALKVRVKKYPTHIAGLPVVVNLNCHVARHKRLSFEGDL